MLAPAADDRRRLSEGAPQSRHGSGVWIAAPRTFPAFRLSRHIGLASSAATSSPRALRLLWTIAAGALHRRPPSTRLCSGPEVPWVPDESECTVVFAQVSNNKFNKVGILSILSVYLNAPSRCLFRNQLITMKMHTCTSSCLDLLKLSMSALSSHRVLNALPVTFAIARS